MRRLIDRLASSRIPRPPAEAGSRHAGKPPNHTIVPEERKTYLTDKPNHSKQRLNTAWTPRNAEHARPTATAPDIDATTSPRSLPPSRKQPVRTAQGPLPSTTDPETQERTATVVAEHVRTVVDSFPPLTPEQRDRIATLLHRSNRGDGPGMTNPRTRAVAEGS